MNPIECLRRARDMITNPDNWCTGQLFRRGEYGHRQYCVLGAINMAQRGNPCYWNNRTEEDCQALKLLDDVCVRLFGDDPNIEPTLTVGSPLVSVNNALGHSAIMLALDTAIGDYPDHAIKEPAYEKKPVSATAESSPL